MDETLAHRISRLGSSGYVKIVNQPVPTGIKSLKPTDEPAATMIRRVRGIAPTKKASK
jgi:hypothetical protein